MKLKERWINNYLEIYFNNRVFMDKHSNVSISAVITIDNMLDKHLIKYGYKIVKAK